MCHSETRAPAEIARERLGSSASLRTPKGRSADPSEEGSVSSLFFSLFVRKERAVFNLPKKVCARGRRGSGKCRAPTPTKPPRGRAASSQRRDGQLRRARVYRHRGAFKRETLYTFSWTLCCGDQPLLSMNRKTKKQQLSQHLTFPPPTPTPNTSLSLTPPHPKNTTARRRTGACTTARGGRTASSACSSRSRWAASATAGLALFTSFRSQNTD